MCVWVDLGDNVLNCHKCHNTKKIHFDLKWNMTLRCSLQVNEIYLQYRQTKHFWTDVLFLPWYLLLNAPRPIMHITTCIIFYHSEDLHWFLQETLWHCECVQLWAQFDFAVLLKHWSDGIQEPLWTDMQLLAYWSVFAQRLKLLFCNIFTVVYKHAYSSSHVASEYPYFFILSLQTLKRKFMQALIWVKAGFLHIFLLHMLLDFLQVNYCPVFVIPSCRVSLWFGDVWWDVFRLHEQSFRPPLILWDRLL